MTSNKLEAEKLINEIFGKCLTPEPMLSVSEWAAKNRILTSESSSEPGQWDNDRTPFLIEIMDCLSITHPSEKVVFKKGSQIGGTETGNNWLGYIIDHVPAPTMLILPTLELAKRTANQRISKLMDASPSIAKKMKEQKSRSKTEQTLMRSFPGGVLVISGANSASSLKSTPCCFLFFDEIDEFVDDLDGQGDPITLAMVRSRTFARQKAFLVSSPTIDGASKIDDEFEASDKRYYNVPCPHCKKLQTLKFEQLKWPGKEDPYMEQKFLEAVYYCEHCGEAIEESDKADMLRPKNGAKWIATAQSMTPGFHLNSLYSPWFAWWKVARDYVAAVNEMMKEKKNGKMKVFVNTILGNTWKDSGEAPEWKRLYERRESYQPGIVPSRGVVLTCGVDVQKDRLEMEVVAWAEGKESWSVDYNVIPGDTTKPETWLKLGEYIQGTFPHEDGHDLPIQLTAVDSGYNTQHVYAFCRKYAMNRVIAVKGVDVATMPVIPPKNVDVKKNGKTIRRGVQVWKLGSTLLKSELFGFLKQDMPDPEIPDSSKGYPHFPQYSEEFFKQLCAEELRVKKNKKNQNVYEFVKIRERNESLDTRCYARAASIVIGIDRFRQKDWDARRVKKDIVKPLETKDNENRPTKSQGSSKKKAKRKSEYWG